MRQNGCEPDGHYDVLQVSPRASSDVIKAAYRTLARASHPDRNGAEDAAQRMNELNRAWEVLSNPARRAEYDLQRLRASRRLVPLEAISGARPVPNRRPHLRRGFEGPDRGRAIIVAAVAALFMVLMATATIGLLGALSDDEAGGGPVAVSTLPHAWP